VSSIPGEVRLDKSRPLSRIYRPSLTQTYVDLARNSATFIFNFIRGLDVCLVKISITELAIYLLLMYTQQYPKNNFISSTEKSRFQSQSAFAPDGVEEGGALVVAVSGRQQW